MADLVRGHILAGLEPMPDQGERFDTLLQHGKVRIERILSPPATSTPPGQWLVGEQEEFVLVIEGRAELEIEGRSRIDLNPGDHLTIPAGCRHRIISTDAQIPTVWLAVHL